MYCRPFFGGKEYFVTVSLERRLKNGCWLPGVIRLRTPPSLPPKVIYPGEINSPRGIIPRGDLLSRISYSREIDSPENHTPWKIDFPCISFPAEIESPGCHTPDWHTRAPQTVELSQSIGNKRLNSAGLFGINGRTQPFVPNRLRQNS